MFTRRLRTRGYGRHTPGAFPHLACLPHSGTLHLPKASFASLCVSQFSNTPTRARKIEADDMFSIIRSLTSGRLFTSGNTPTTMANSASKKRKSHVSDSEDETNGTKPSIPESNDSETALLKGKKRRATPISEDPDESADEQTQTQDQDEKVKDSQNDDAEDQTEDLPQPISAPRFKVSFHPAPPPDRGRGKGAKRQRRTSTNSVEADDEVNDREGVDGRLYLVEPSTRWSKLKCYRNFVSTWGLVS